MFKKNQLRKALSLFVCLALALSLFAGLTPGGDNPVHAASGDVERLAGDDRYETSAKIADKKFTTSSYAIITRGDAYADGLAASVLSGALNAPVLLVRSNTLPDSISSRLTALGKPRVIILGGTVAVSTAVENALKDLVGSSYVTRLGGADRFATAALVAAEAAKYATLSRTAFIVNGFASADSLVAGPAAFRDRMPILQVYKDSIPDVTKQAIANRGINKIIIVGGTDVVSNSVATALGKLSGVSSVRRLWGSTRYETSVEFAKDQFPYVGNFCLVRGADDNLADAIGATVLGYPILYVEQNSIRTEVNNYLDSRVTSSSEIFVIGGIAAVSDTVRDRARALVSGTAVFNPAQDATNVSTSVQPTISFPRAISNTSGTAITDSNVDSLITFRRGGSSGTSVSFTASIDSGKRVITVYPTSALDTNTTYYLAVDSVRDTGGTISSSSVTWSTGTTATGPPASVLGLSSAECVSLREIKVVFNQAVTKTSAEDTGNYNVWKPNNDVDHTSVESAKLQSDGRSVLLTIQDPLVKDKPYRMKAKNVYSTGGRYIDEPYDIRAFIAVDNTRPTVESIITSGTNKLEVTMNEFMADTPAPIVKIDGVYVGDGKVGWVDSDRKKFTVEGVTWGKGQEYEITITGAKDLYGKEMVPYVKKIKPYTDDKGPKISSISAVDQDTVRVVFDRTLDSDISSATVTYTRKAGGSITKNLNQAAFGRDPDDSTGKVYLLDVTYDLDTYQLFATTTSESIEIKLIGLKDVLGKTGTEANLKRTVTLKKDTTGPYVTTHTVSTDSKTITLYLNELVDMVGSVNQIKIYDQNGEEVVDLKTTVLEDDAVNNISTITIAKQTDKGRFLANTHTISIPGGILQDGRTYSQEFTGNTTIGGVNKNKLINYKVNVGAPANNPKISDSSCSTDNVFTITFNVPMEKASALNKSNYRLDGSALGSDAFLYFQAASDQQTVVIDLTSTDTVKFTGTGTITATGSIRSVYGLSINETYLTMGGFLDNTRPVLNKAEKDATAKTIYLTFNEPVTENHNVLDNYEIKFGSTIVQSSDLTNQAVTAVDASNGFAYTVKITFIEGLSWNSTVKVTVKETADAEDAANNTLKPGVSLTAQVKK